MLHDKLCVAIDFLLTCFVVRQSVLQQRYAGERSNASRSESNCAVHRRFADDDTAREADT